MYVILFCLLLEPSAARRKHSKSTLLVKNLSVAECSMRHSYRNRTSDTRMLCDAGNVPIAPRSITMNQLCWWKICLSRSAQWDKVIEIEPAIHACYATQGTCLARLVALPWISKDISLHHCATDVRLYVWPYRIFLVTQTTNRVLGSSFLAKRSLCSLVVFVSSLTVLYPAFYFSFPSISSNVSERTTPHLPNATWINPDRHQLRIYRCVGFRTASVGSMEFRAITL